MSMTPEQAEKSARYEAKLLGGELRTAPRRSGVMMYGIDMPGEWFIREPLNPYDPADMWELVRLMLKSRPDSVLELELVADDTSAEFDLFIWEKVNATDHQKKHIAWAEGKTPLEAAQAAWFKLCEEQSDE